MKSVWWIISIIAAGIVGLFVGHKYGKTLAEKATDLKNEIKDKTKSKGKDKDNTTPPEGNK